MPTTPYIVQREHHARFKKKKLLLQEFKGKHMMLLTSSLVESRGLKEVLDAASVEGAGPPNDTMHLAIQG